MLGLAPAGAATVAVAAVTAAAQHDLRVAAGAQVQAGVLFHAHPGTAEVLDGCVPARHTDVAPPSSHGVGRATVLKLAGVQTDVAPTFFGFDPRCTAAGHRPLQAPARWREPRFVQTPQLPEQTSPSTKPPPHRRIVAVLGQRSHWAAGGTRIMREPWDTCARNGHNGLQTGRDGRCNRCADQFGRPVSSKSTTLVRSMSIFSTAC